MPLSFDLLPAERELLSQLAHQSIETYLAGNRSPVSPSDSVKKSQTLQRSLGGFVTLYMDGQLRGCIGHIVGSGPLYATIWDMARAAAFQDPRFHPLRAAEWPHVHMEISVLDELTPCPSVDEIEIGRHGLLLQYRGHSGVFLPQVPVDQGWDLYAYLKHLCLKAGVHDKAWQEADAHLYWYEALVFPA